MESVAVINDTKIHPGYIYIRDRQSFYPPKEDLEIHVREIEESPFKVELTKITLENFKAIEGNPAITKLWKNDLNTMVTTGQSFSMSVIKCSVWQSKKIKDWPMSVSIDFEYANIVTYQYDILMLVKHLERFQFDQFSSYFQGMWDGKTDKQLLRNKVHPYFGLQSIKICYQNFLCQRQGFIPMRQALNEIVAVFKVICENNTLESVRAVVNKLPPRIKNKSEVACILQKQQSLISSIYYGFLGLLWAGNENKPNDNLERERTFQEIQSIVDANCNESAYESPYNFTCDESIIDKIEDFCNDSECNENNDHDQSTIEKKPVMSDSKGDTFQFGEYKLSLERKSVVQVGEERCLIQFDDDVEEYIKVKSPPATIDKMAKKQKKAATEAIMLWTENELNCGKVEKELMTTNFKSNNSVIPVSVNLPKNLPDQKSKKDSEIRSPGKQSKHTPEVTNNLKSEDIRPPEEIKTKDPKCKMLDPCRTEQIGDFLHCYYKCPEKVADLRDKVTLLLFGSEDRGQISTLNLLWYCSQNDENVQPIIGTSSKIEHVSFYHFGLSFSNFKELVVIITPKFTASALENLMKHLSDGILNVNALGFVVNSRSETLTSEERSFFNFIRSSFGEVSNHHLMTFLTFCDFSRNFPVLEEMTHQSVKSKYTFEMNNFEADLSKKLDALELALASNDLKKGKKIYKTLKEMPLLSVKSIKMAQEKSFAKFHLEAAFQQLKKELHQFVVNVNSEHDLKRNVVGSIWKLAKLGLALQKNQSSEKDLVQFLAKLLSDILVNENKKLSKCFLLLVIYCPSMNICASMHVILRLYSELFKASYLDPKIESPLSITVLKKDEASIYCKCCRDIHIGKLCRRNNGHFIALQCLNCNCSGDDHSLWTLQDTINFSKSFCKDLDRTLRELLDVLPKLPFTIDHTLFLDVLLEVFPQYKMLLKMLMEVRKKK